LVLSYAWLPKNWSLQNFSDLNRFLNRLKNRIISPKRDADNLLNVIYKYVAPGTTIMSDRWKAYSRIDRLDHKYKHLTVNYSLYFVSPDDPTLHTNSVESIWCSAKVHFKMMRGVKRAYLQSYLDEYSYRRNNDLTKVGAFEAILTSIADQYMVGDL